MLTRLLAMRRGRPAARMNHEQNLQLDDLLAEAAAKLSEDGKPALGAAVSLARARLATMRDSLETLATRGLGSRPASTFARAILDCIDQDPIFELIVDDTLVERRESP